MSQAREIVSALRTIAPGGKLLQPEIPHIDAIAALWAARAAVAPQPDPVPPKGDPGDTAWIRVARGLIGQREVPGPQHNSWIARGWARLGAGWFNDDETPWCGYFVAHCLEAAGLDYPRKGAFARALAWRDWGSGSAAQLGAIGVKGRTGGGHVFFIVGQTADGRFFKALGGNQRNQVSIVDIRRSDVLAIRWPAGAPRLVTGLPTLPAGTISGSEA